MEFDKTKVFTAVNADEVQVGSKVVVADGLLFLKARVMGNVISELIEIEDESSPFRFKIRGKDIAFNLCYLVAPPEKEKKVEQEATE